MNEFITYLQKKDLSPSTQEAYLFNVEQFLNRYKGEPENTEKKDICRIQVTNATFSFVNNSFFTNISSIL